MWRWLFGRRATSRNDPKQMDNSAEEQVPSTPPAESNHNQQANTSTEIHEETPLGDRNAVTNSTPLQANRVDKADEADKGEMAEAADKADEADKGDKEPRRLKMQKKMRSTFPGRKVINSVS